jgi:hypothetical protein
LFERSLRRNSKAGAKGSNDFFKNKHLKKSGLVAARMHPIKVLPGSTTINLGQVVLTIAG